MPETIIDLGRKVKAKYPGQYDDLSDDEVGRKVKSKFPGQYDDFTDVGSAADPNAAVLAAQKAKFPTAAEGGDPNLPWYAGYFGQGNDPNRTAGQVASDQAANVLKGIPQAVTGIPGTIKEAAGGIFEVLSGHRAHRLAGMVRGMAEPIITPIKQGIELAAPGAVNAPTVEDPRTAQSAQAAGANLAALELPNALSGAGLLAKKVGSVAVDTTAPLRESLSGSLRESAVRSIKQVLNPTTKGNKVLAQRVAPRLASEGPIAMTMKGYKAKLAAGRAAAGEALGEAQAAVPSETTLRTRPIIDAIEQSKLDSGAIVQGQKGPVVVEPDLVRAADGLKDIISEFGPEVSYDSMVKLRQRWDQTVAKAKGFVQQDVGAGIDMKRDAAAAIREELAKDQPSIAKLNAEYSFWANGSKVLKDTLERKTGQATSMGEQIATGAGVAGGLATGGIGAAFESAAIVRGLTKLFRSTGWRTVSARIKSTLADALASGDTPTVQRIIESEAPSGAAAVPVERTPMAFPSGMAKLGANLPKTEPRLLTQLVEARMREIKDIARSGATESTGKALGRETERGSANFDTESVRRGKGMLADYPELKNIGAQPAAIASAIDKGSGALYDRIRATIADSLSDIVESQKGSAFGFDSSRQALFDQMRSGRWSSK